ncbi:MAG: hypothetical protein EOO65_03640, partial [Methanosarcinales archaeon]
MYPATAANTPPSVPPGAHVEAAASPPPESSSTPCCAGSTGAGGMPSASIPTSSAQPPPKSPFGAPVFQASPTSAPKRTAKLAKGTPQSRQKVKKSGMRDGSTVAAASKLFATLFVSTESAGAAAQPVHVDAPPPTAVGAPVKGDATSGAAAVAGSVEGADAATNIINEDVKNKSERSLRGTPSLSAAAPAFVVRSIPSTADPAPAAGAAVLNPFASFPQPPPSVTPPLQRTIVFPPTFTFDATGIPPTIQQLLHSGASTASPVTPHLFQRMLQEHIPIPATGLSPFAQFMGGSAAAAAVSPSPPPAEPRVPHARFHEVITAVRADLAASSSSLPEELVESAIALAGEDKVLLAISFLCRAEVFVRHCRVKAALIDLQQVLEWDAQNKDALLQLFDVAITFNRYEAAFPYVDTAKELTATLSASVPTTSVFVERVRAISSVRQAVSECTTLAGNRNDERSALSLAKSASLIACRMTTRRYRPLVLF